MSREQYTPPSLSQNQTTTAAGTSSGTQQPNIFNVTQTADDLSRPVSYLCSQCDEKIQLKAKDVIRCKACGGRVLYKERTARMVQFEAR